MSWQQACSGLVIGLQWACNELASGLQQACKRLVAGVQWFYNELAMGLQ